MLYKKLFGCFGLLLLSTNIFAAEINFEKNISWVSNRDITEQVFDEKLNVYKNSGYIMTNIEVYNTSSGKRLSMVWKENTGNREWIVYREIFSNEYDGLVKLLKATNFRLVDMVCYQNGANLSYAAIFVKNTENYLWQNRKGQTLQEYLKYRDSIKNEGYTITDFEAYKTSSGYRYASVSVKYGQAPNFIQEMGLTRTQYQRRIELLTANGYILTNYETQTEGNGARSYSIIVQKKAGFAHAVRTDITATQFANYWRKYQDMGYRLVDFDCYERDGKLIYGGNWIECDERFRYPQKEDLDNLVENFKSLNTLPGISVAIIKDGKMLYRRGFGYADIENKKEAHGETIYLAGSNSKVIGGTLAVKLHAKKKLRNGQAVDFDLYRNIRRYLTDVKRTDGNNVSIPPAHRYNIAELCAHLACLNHYSDDDNCCRSLQPDEKQYKKAIDALILMWDKDLTFNKNCLDTFKENYSTNAFTYLAAVLEEVTGKSVAELIRTEIAEPYNLNTMRAQYETDPPITKYDRAEPYGKNKNHLNKYPNNSWKVLGGGIEISPVDLATFGWKILNGEIVNPLIRDSIMWTKVNAGVGAHGIAWQLNGSSIAQHGGNSAGNRSYFRIYRNQGVVIAAMTNTKESNSLDALVDDLADIVIVSTAPAGLRTPKKLKEYFIEEN